MASVVSAGWQRNVDNGEVRFLTVRNLKGVENLLGQLSLPPQINSHIP